MFAPTSNVMADRGTKPVPANASCAWAFDDARGPKSKSRGVCGGELDRLDSAGDPPCPVSNPIWATMSRSAFVGPVDDDDGEGEGELFSSRRRLTDSSRVIRIGASVFLRLILRTNWVETGLGRGKSSWVEEKTKLLWLLNSSLLDPMNW